MNGDRSNEKGSHRSTNAPMPTAHVALSASMVTVVQPRARGPHGSRPPAHHSAAVTAPFKSWSVQLPETLVPAINPETYRYAAALVAYAHQGPAEPVSVDWGTTVKKYVSADQLNVGAPTWTVNMFMGVSKRDLYDYLFVYDFDPSALNGDTDEMGRFGLRTPLVLPSFNPNVPGLYTCALATCARDLRARDLRSRRSER